MGRRAAPDDPSSSGLIRLGAVVPPLIGRRLLSLLALLTGSLVLVTASLPASAQTVSQRIKSRSAKETGDQARMLVEAQRLGCVGQADKSGHYGRYSRNANKIAQQVTSSRTGAIRRTVAGIALTAKNPVLLSPRQF